MVFFQAAGVAAVDDDAEKTAGAQGVPGGLQRGKRGVRGGDDGFVATGEIAEIGDDGSKGANGLGGVAGPMAMVRLYQGGARFEAFRGKTAAGGSEGGGLEVKRPDESGGPNEAGEGGGVVAVAGGQVEGKVSGTEVFRQPGVQDMGEARQSTSAERMRSGAALGPA